MYTVDDRLKGLPAAREQIVSLHQSLNQPHLAVPGRHAGPAQATVLGLKGQHGYGVFVHLYLPESNEVAVYLPSNRSVPWEQFEAAESDGLSFVESMGFIMDNLNFRSRPEGEQAEWMKTLPVFQKEPPRPTATASGAGPVKASPQASLGRLLASFCVVAFATLGCKHVMTEKEERESEIHYDLGIQVQSTDAQGALREFDRALELNPNMAEAHNAKGVLLHMSFGRLDEAIDTYKQALALKPTFSDVKTNLANVYLDQKRYDDAIALYDQALNDMLYSTPFIAHGNRGWALYKKGDLRAAVDAIKTATTLNPRFCLGHKNLGLVYEETGDLANACKAFTKFREQCPNVSETYVRDAMCQLKLGAKDKAATVVEACFTKATTDADREDCQRAKDALNQ